MNFAIQYEGNQKLLHIRLRNIELLGDEWDSYSSEGPHHGQYHLRANVFQQIFYVIANEEIIVDGSPATQLTDGMLFCFLLPTGRLSAAAWYSVGTRRL